MAKRKLTDEDYLELATIAILRAFGVGSTEIANRLGVTQQTVYNRMDRESDFCNPLSKLVREFLTTERLKITLKKEEYEARMERLLGKTAQLREDILDDKTITAQNPNVALRNAESIENRLLGMPKTTNKIEGGTDNTHTLTADPSLVKLLNGLHERNGLAPLFSPDIIDVTPTRVPRPAITEGDHARE